MLETAKERDEARQQLDALQLEAAEAVQATGQERTARELTMARARATSQRTVAMRRSHAQRGIETVPPHFILQLQFFRMAPLLVDSEPNTKARNQTETRTKRRIYTLIWNRTTRKQAPQPRSAGPEAGI